VRLALRAALLLALLSPAAASRVGAITAADARTKSFKLQADGMRFYNEKKYREAIEALQQAVNIHLNSFMAWYYLGSSLAAERRYGEAVEPIKIALDLQPDYVQAHLALGDTYLKLGETDEARACYLRAIDLQANYAPAHDGMGRMLESLGRDDEAEASYRKALEINVAFADAYTHLGELYLRQGRLQDATALFLKAISIKPDFSQAYTRLGVALSRQDRFDDAMAAARKSMQLAPRDPEPLVALARIDLEMQSLRRTRQALDSALAIDPDFVFAHLFLSDLARAEGDPARAVTVLETRLQRPIDDPRQKRVVLDALKRDRTEVKKLAVLQIAVAAAPTDPQALAALARFHAGMNAHAMAADLLRAAAEHAGTEDAAPLLYEAGVELTVARRWPEAIAVFQSLATPIADPPADSTPASGPPPVAAASLAADALFNLGVAQAGAGLDDAAARTFRACLDARPDDLQAQLYLGNALFRLGRRDEARVAYGAWLERSGGAPEAERVRRLIQGPDAAPTGSTR
jgi:tetratricopeptide (TPR) repeat protein